MVHDLDQDTKGIWLVLKTLYTKTDRGGKALIRLTEPDQAESGPSGRQVKWIFATLSACNQDEFNN